MDIEISESLKSYLRKKDIRDIVLDLPMRKVCCSGPYIPLVRRLKKQDKVSDYILEVVDGVNIYKNRGIKCSRKKLKIGIRKTFGLVEMYCFDPDNICVCGGNIKEV